MSEYIDHCMDKKHQLAVGKIVARMKAEAAVVEAARKVHKKVYSYRYSQVCVLRLKEAVAALEELEK